MITITLIQFYNFLKKKFYFFIFICTNFQNNITTAIKYSYYSFVYIKKRLDIFFYSAHLLSLLTSGKNKKDRIKEQTQTVQGK